MRAIVALVITVAVVGTCGCAPALGSKRATTSTVVPSNATVEAVVDGDTIVVRIRGHTEHVRLIGIDTPETVAPGKPVMCFGKEATNETARLLPRGTPIELVRDAEARDDYARLLAYVYRATDGLSVNVTLAREGFADALSIPPNTAHAGEFRAAVAAARRERRGLWGACGRFGQPVASPP
jgi:micrococcal nuclease